MCWFLQSNNVTKQKPYNAAAMPSGSYWSIVGKWDENIVKAKRFNICIPFMYFRVQLTIPGTIFTTTRQKTRLQLDMDSNRTTQDWFCQTRTFYSTKFGFLWTQIICFTLNLSGLQSTLISKGRWRSMSFWGVYPPWLDFAYNITNCV